MANYLLHPATTGRAMTVHGRAYNSPVGTPLVVPDFDITQLEANGWVNVGQTGTTAQRPAVPFFGQRYADSTLALMIFWDGRTWRNTLTGASV